MSGGFYLAGPPSSWCLLYKFRKRVCLRPCRRNSRTHRWYSRPRRRSVQVQGTTRRSIDSEFVSAVPVQDRHRNIVGSRRKQSSRRWCSRPRSRCRSVQEHCHSGRLRPWRSPSRSIRRPFPAVRRRHSRHRRAAIPSAVPVQVQEPLAIPEDSDLGGPVPVSLRTGRLRPAQRKRSASTEQPSRPVPFQVQTTRHS